MITAKRIIYALLTATSVGVFIWTENPAALFLCVLLFAVPVITFVMLLIARRTVKFDCAIRQTCMRGGKLEIEMKIGVTPRFFVGSAEVKLNINNTTFNKNERKTFVFENLSYAPGLYNYIGTDSGRIRIEVLEIRLIDMFGLCTYKFKNYSCFESIIAPLLYENLHISLRGLSRYRSMGETVDVAKRGSDRSEIFNIRDYVAGDSLNAVHWKLSSKFDTLKTKEFGSTNDYRSLILVDLSRNKNDHTATDDDLNSVLDAAISISDAFLADGLAHCVGWLDNGRLRFNEVVDNSSFLDMIINLMSAKVTEEDAKALFYLASESIAEDFSKFILVSSDANLNELKQISGEVTAVSIGDSIGEYSDERFKIINIRCDSVERALTAVEL